MVKTMCGKLEQKGEENKVKKEKTDETVRESSIKENLYRSFEIGRFKYTPI